MTQQLLFDAFRYTPIEPSMVDAKNAVLIADLVDYSGAHLNTLYTTFARRGLGVSAATSSGSYSTAPLSDWIYQHGVCGLRHPVHPLRGRAAVGGVLRRLRRREQLDGDGDGRLRRVRLWHVSSRRSSSGRSRSTTGARPPAPTTRDSVTTAP